ncbi:hypothetical protein V2A87_47445, partial [Pseudomonas aeruginosa]
GQQEAPADVAPQESREEEEGQAPLRVVFPSSKGPAGIPVGPFSLAAAVARGTNQAAGVDRRFPVVATNDREVVIRPAPSPGAYSPLT